MYCYSCGTRLPALAAYCPACGCAVQSLPAPNSAGPHASGDASPSWRVKKNPKTIGPYIVGFIILLIAMTAYAWQMRSKTVAASAASNYRRLSGHLVQLIGTRSALDSVRSKLIKTSTKLSTDLSQVQILGDRAHDIHDPYAQSDDVRIALNYANDAKTQEAALEDIETQYLGAWQPAYGSDATRQLRLDLVAGNEATENQISEWERGLDEISDDLTEQENFQPWQYPSGEIVSHYTTGSTASTNAMKFRRLSSADAEGLVARLGLDVAKTKSQIAALEARYPDLAPQKQGP